MNRKWKAVIWASVLLVLSAGGYSIYLYQSVKQVAVQIYEEREPDPAAKVLKIGGGSGGSGQAAAEPALSRDASKPFTVLVLGVDQRPHDRGRSDVMILLAVNPVKESILMFNIPRDTRTDIVGRGTVDKINHAYAFGGVDMSVRTVEHFLQYPVDRYIRVNMEGFSKIIDLLGGVRIHNSLAFDYAGYHFPKGQLDLNGEEALAFSRMRYEDPRGDLGRNERQREIVKELIQNALDISTVFKLQSLLEQVGTSVKTDISFEEMKLLITDYRSKLNKVEQKEIKGQGKMLNGIWYYMVTDQEKESIKNSLKSFME